LPPPQSTPSACDHYWLARPISLDEGGWVNYLYPYGTTGGGDYLLHHGIDLAGDESTHVLAVDDGVVVVAGDDHEVAYGPTTDFYGNLVVIKLDRTYKDKPIFCLYGHLSKVLVEPGQKVQKGDVLGMVGSTGIALGAHLHFEVRIGENSYYHTRNPLLWIEPLPKRGTIAGRIEDVEGNLPPELPLVFRSMQDPTKEWGRTWTYRIAQGIHPDDDLGETFVLGDVPPGKYLMEVKIGPHTYKRLISVESGKTSFVEVKAVD